MLRTAVVVTVAIILTSLAGAAMAESGQPVPPARGPAMLNKARGERSDPDRRLALLREALGLSDDQVARIRPVIVAEQGELQKLRGDNTLNRDQRRVKLQELNKATSGKIREMLDPGQQKKYDEIKSTITENRTKNRGARPGEIPADFSPEKRLARLNARLDLTKEQQEKLLPILQEEYGELKKLPANDTYNRDQRRARLQELTQATNARILPLLTPEQQKKFQDSRTRMIERRAQKKKGGEKGLERSGQPQ